MLHCCSCFKEKGVGNSHQEGGIERQWNHSVDQEKHLNIKAEKA